MKKSALIVGIVGILAIGYTGSSWYFGSKIKHNVYETLPLVQQRLNDILADNDLFYDKEIQLVISEYEQNIFSSDLKVEIVLIDNYGLTQKEIKLLDSKEPYSYEELARFSDNLTIYHGPFPISHILKGDLIPKQALLIYQLTKTPKFIQKAIDNKPLLTLEANFDLNDNSHVIIETPPINIKNRDYSLTVSANKVILDQSTDGDLLNQHSDLIIKNIDFTVYSPYFDIIFKLDNFNLQSNVNYDFIKKNFSATAKMQTNEFSITDKSETSVRFKDILLLTNQDTINSTGTINFDIGSITYSEQNLGKFNTKLSYHAKDSRDLFENMELDIENISLETSQGTLKAQYKNKYFMKSDLFYDPSDIFSENEFNELNIETHVSLPAKALALLSSQLQNKHQIISFPDLFIDPKRQIASNWLTTRESYTYDDYTFYPFFDINEDNNSIESNIIISLEDNKMIINGKSIEYDYTHRVFDNFDKDLFNSYYINIPEDDEVYEE